MGVHFDKSRMERVRAAHDSWFEGKLNRPLLSITLYDAYPSDKPLENPLTMENYDDFSRSPEEVIELLDRQLSTCEFIGDGFPFVDLSAFGPGVLAAFCGGKADNSTGTVWFSPPDGNDEKPLSEIHAEYNPTHPWAERIKAIYKAGLDRWNGCVMLGIPDLGGILDVASSLIGSERLLYALIDEPDEVFRLISELEQVWYAAYNDFAAVLAPQNGYTNWSGLLSSVPSYILQCDFSYMISPQMFSEFVLPTLRRDTEKLGYTIYHLDGVGQLPHLDAILSLEKLNAVQWVYGAGKPTAGHWIDIYRRITESGRGIMVIDGVPEFLSVLNAFRCTPYSRLRFSAKDRETAEKLLTAR
ncbi:MAG: hypothetical protein GX633_01740 [Clostridiales bacterium]|jgi:hypothetical protein|nr:hypothetical protein [Clostridiales bacterium]